MQFSLKVKILLTIVMLTLTSLTVFSVLTFNSYKKDKLAFVYDHMASETQSKSTLISSVIEHYDFYIGSIISRLDLNTKQLHPGTQKFLHSHQNLLGIYYHLPEDAPELVLHRSANREEDVSWQDLHLKDTGLSLLNQKSARFIFKKPLTVQGGYVVIAFHHPELINMLNSGSGRINFLLHGEQLLSKKAVSLSSESLNSLKTNFARNPASFGLFETQLENEEYFVSYSRLPYKGMVLVNLIEKQKVLLIQEVFLKQVLVFLVLMGSISLLIGTITSRWITLHLDDLTQAAQEMENENFDYVVKVRSNDEFGLLGDSFNSMSSKIRDLLDELRKYNTQLEQMVEDRTCELQNLTNIQNAMLNSLGQGFVIVSKDHNILPVYSKVAIEMFESVPDQVDPGTLLGLKTEDVDSFRELYEMTFNQMLDFDDMVSMNPSSRSNSKHQHIQLNYAPIRNEKDQLEYVLIIGTDKTKEIENMAKFKKEWAFSQMIMRIVSNRYSLIKVIKESLSMIRLSIETLDKPQPHPVRSVQRYIHTIKGSFSYFHIEEITKFAHDFESFLEPFYNQEHLGDDLKLQILEKLVALQVSIECYIDSYDKIIQFKNAALQKSIPIKDLDAFGKELKAKHPAWYEKFHAQFYRSEIQPYFQMYPSIISELGLKLNKKVKFILEGGQNQLPERQWEELFGQFIHFVRNSVDHGIETEQERVAAGKDATGEIKFGFKVSGDKLEISLSDDGRGILWEKIAKKDSSITNEQEAIQRIMMGGISSKDEVSDVSGRGVGVSSLFSMVQKWNGDIQVINHPGQGMALKIQVPLKKNANLKQVA